MASVKTASSSARRFFEVSTMLTLRREGSETKCERVAVRNTVGRDDRARAPVRHSAVAGLFEPTLSTGTAQRACAVEP